MKDKLPVTFSSFISGKNSFDFLRFFFAFSVFVYHFRLFTGTKMYFPISGPMAVAGFFIISGFLIMRSYYRSTGLTDFAIKRIRRIVPAYFFVVIACAFFFSLISSFSFSQYFGSKTFFKYLAANLCFLNFIQPVLPGVFTTNMLPYVNGSLWTIKVELALYASIPLIALLLKRKPIFVLIGLYFISFVFVYYMNYLYGITGNRLYFTLSAQFLGQIQFLTSGIIILFYFDFLRKQMKFFLSFSVIIFLSNYFIPFPVIAFLYPFAFAILIVFFAYYFKQLACFSKYGDFSYGMYLFHYPVIQLIIHFGWFKENKIVFFLMSFMMTLFLSVLSWHLLEKRFLTKKRLHAVYDETREKNKNNI